MTIRSTEQAAQRAKISYITLRRWLAAGKFKPSIAIPAAGGRMLWGWTDEDVKRLCAFKAANYRKGEGRPKKGK